MTFHVKTKKTFLRTANHSFLRNGFVEIDVEKDSLLTDFGKITMRNQYLYGGESYQEMFERVASSYADNNSHAQRMYNYISSLWFMPATPVLGNAGVIELNRRGHKKAASLHLPISCYLNEAQDTLDSVARLLIENMFLGAGGGGIGSYFGNVRPAGRTGTKESAGVIPFAKIIESITQCVSQGVRRGAAAIFLPISHPEILDFIQFRRPSGGDPQRKVLHLNHGVVISDAFMNAVQYGKPWNLVNPQTREIVETIDAREIWAQLLTIRLETGEPYLIFIDHVNASIPQYQKDLGLEVKTSNLCTEIFLPTGLDQHGMNRTAVCCLGSVNLVKFLDWKDDPYFIEDCLRFLDNVLEDFVCNAPESFKDAIYSVQQGRAVGLGVMGWHSFLQSLGIPMHGLLAKTWNKHIFSHIHQAAKSASQRLAQERGPCKDAKEKNVMERFSYATAVAPTASISILCGGASPGIEPIVANAYTHKTMSGLFFIKNPYLVELLEKKNADTEDVWESILANDGSVQHLDILSSEEKEVFLTAYEIRPEDLIQLAADRTPYVDQGQSLNLFFAPDVSKLDLHNAHWNAWKKGVKSLYYLRSRSLKSGETHRDAKQTQKNFSSMVDKYYSENGMLQLEYENCLVCQ
ncbi:putative ribonucleoside-diphosphate reductase large subunit [Holospora obtusa F1]|uniref:Ribonucleoside-diphosphate reductase n=1 Tax=Holospora obtusa F1 TaxID=1399147 RepID=W6TDA6_HOLOB|nr:ribonucleoside-diphosphate reductase subunit alpha [Holospora obtusa]ETZ06716.1 putative ribonucleoside-diphosphate reductase large subunit [Holospora obtusa F1]